MLPEIWERRPKKDRPNEQGGVVKFTEELSRLSDAATQGELLPCPFCGLPQAIRSNRDWHHITQAHDDDCPISDVDFTAYATDAGRANLVVTWNRRADPLANRRREILALVEAAKNVVKWSDRDTEIADLEKALLNLDEAKP